MAVYKFTFNPNDDYDVAEGYNYVEVAGGDKDDDLDTVVERFIQFLQGVGFTVDRDKVGYGL